jgi:hypothetical protein
MGWPFTIRNSAEQLPPLPPCVQSDWIGLSRNQLQRNARSAPATSGRLRRSESVATYRNFISSDREIEEAKLSIALCCDRCGFR